MTKPINIYIKMCSLVIKVRAIFVSMMVREDSLEGWRGEADCVERANVCTLRGRSIVKGSRERWMGTR